jgi:hypothetical protein
LADANTGRRLAEIDQAGGGHSYARHGPQTTPEELMNRVHTGLTPDGVAGQPQAASRFLSNQDQLEAIQRAQTIRAQTGDDVLDVQMDRIIGEGYPRNALSYDDLIRTSNVRVVFNTDGTVKTAYPLIKVLP